MKLIKDMPDNTTEAEAEDAPITFDDIMRNNMERKKRELEQRKKDNDMVKRTHRMG